MSIISKQQYAPTTGWTVPGPQTLLLRLLNRLHLWQRRYQDRRRLLGLNDRLLRDIGISRGDIEIEARKPFWRG